MIPSLFHKEEKLRQRRSFSRFLNNTLLAAGLAFSSLTLLAEEQIFDLGQQREISRADLLESLKKSDVILLGELHDNSQHHERRAELLQALRSQHPIIVAEHLERGQRATADGDLLTALEAAGFDAKNWRWPLHAPLFATARQLSLALYGGNITRTQARAVVQQGGAALPQDIAQALQEAPLSESAQSNLHQDLLDNHCGQIPQSLVPGLTLAQRARDAAMALAITRAAQTAQSGQPVILFAGNGHVRRDYGVPVLLEKLSPARKTLAIAWLETGKPDNPPLDVLKTRFDIVWYTAPAERQDPCLNFPKR